MNGMHKLKIKEETWYYIEYKGTKWNRQSKRFKQYHLAKREYFRQSNTYGCTKRRLVREVTSIKTRVL